MLGPGTGLFDSSSELLGRMRQMSICCQQATQMIRMGGSPVRIVWNAPSTFASSAEVSMNESPFSSAQGSAPGWVVEKKRIRQIHGPAKALASSVGTARRLTVL
jgi:hypothetical protein